MNKIKFLPSGPSSLVEKTGTLHRITQMNMALQIVLSGKRAILRELP